MSGKVKAADVKRVPRPVPAPSSSARVLIDLSKAPSSMEAMAERWRAGA